MRRLYALLEYNGTRLFGSQEQRGRSLPTVQGELWRAFEELKLAHLVQRIHLASRTDAGVSAQGQVAELDVDSLLVEKVVDLRRALNHVLPADVAVKQLLNPEATENAPSVQFDAVAKWYRYQWHVDAASKSPLQYPASLGVSSPFCMDTVNPALGQFVGTHDFKCFQSAGSNVTNTQVTLHYARVSQQFNSIYQLDVVGNRFLYKMVRNMAAYVQHIGEKGLAFPQPLDLLCRQRQEVFQRTAPALGLRLMAIHYQVPEIQFYSERHTMLRRAFDKDFIDVQDLFRQCL
jgi:tRNA pseudouridine38-40 synthase